MAELKTKMNDQSVAAFLNTVSDPKKREDCQVILELTQKITTEKAKMWGDSIVLQELIKNSVDYLVNRYQ